MSPLVVLADQTNALIDLVLENLPPLADMSPDEAEFYVRVVSPMVGYLPLLSNELREMAGRTSGTTSTIADIMVDLITASKAQGVNADVRVALDNLTEVLSRNRLL